MRKLVFLFLIFFSAPVLAEEERFIPPRIPSAALELLEAKYDNYNIDAVRNCGKLYDELVTLSNRYIYKQQSSGNLKSGLKYSSDFGCGKADGRFIITIHVYFTDGDGEISSAKSDLIGQFFDNEKIDFWFYSR